MYSPDDWRHVSVAVLASLGGCESHTNRVTSGAQRWPGLAAHAPKAGRAS